MSVANEPVGASRLNATNEPVGASRLSVAELGVEPSRLVKLRGYQQNLYDDIRKELKKGKKSVCAVLGCGGGKSIIQGMIAKSATDKGNRVLFLVHRKELCDQIQATFEMVGVDFNLCQIAMVQTITRRLDKTEIPILIITDEVHHCLSASYIRIYEHFDNAIRLGFTATPIRMNEGGLGKVYESLVESVPVKWLVENNFLSPYKYYSVKIADTDNLNVKRGDYDNAQVAELMENNKIYGETVKTYLKLAKNKKTIVYCASVQASIDTAEQFVNQGITCVHVDGTTSKSDRELAILKFRNNEIDVLCNVDLFGEGFDVPDCECVILLRPTKSLTLFIQQSMRSMRYKMDKTAIIIDHVGNVYNHGFPDDEREWSLQARKRKQTIVFKEKECPMCGFFIPKVESFCKECGYVFTKQERAEKDIEDVELTEVTRLEILKAKPYNHYEKVKTFDEMREFQKAKKYKFGWVLHKCIELEIPIPDKYNEMIRRMVKPSQAIHEEVS